MINPSIVRKTSTDDETLVIVAFPRNSAKIMCDRKFQNRK
jgi:hypothetical protein